MSKWVVALATRQGAGEDDWGFVPHSFHETERDAEVERGVLMAEGNHPSGIEVYEVNDGGDTIVTDDDLPF